MLQFVQSKDLAFVANEIKTAISNSRVYVELKPQFFKPPRGQVINATELVEGLSMGFNNPHSKVSHNEGLLAIVDECSRFSSAFVCPHPLLLTVFARRFHYSTSQLHSRRQRASIEIPLMKKAWVLEIHSSQSSNL